MVLRRARLATLIAPLACALVVVLAPADADASARPATARSAAVRQAKPSRVPANFVGMNLSSPVYPPPSDIDMGGQLNTMVSAGVGSLRVVFDWSYAQPYAKWSDVPAADDSEYVNVGGVPTNWSLTDQIMALAATRRMSVLPTVLYTPQWDAAPLNGAQAIAIPKRSGPYAAFCAALVKRYGPHGTFWKTHGPADPIHDWQIWNEPSVRYFWPKQPFAHGYVQLLKAARTAIKGADRTAKIVLAGLPNFSWVQLHTIYNIKGAGKLFDIVAIHPYTKHPPGVITILQKVRNVMDKFGAAKDPIIADELSWPSSAGKTKQTLGLDIGTTEAGQAKNITSVLPLLAQYRTTLNLAAFDYYTWAGIDDKNGNLFDFAGLFHVDSGGKFIAKPAYAAFKRAALKIEGCSRKGSTATACIR
jgi:hypothetical protein